MKGVCVCVCVHGAGRAPVRAAVAGKESELALAIWRRTAESRRSGSAPASRRRVSRSRKDRVIRSRQGRVIGPNIPPASLCVTTKRWHGSKTRRRKKSEKEKETLNKFEILIDRRNE